MNVNFLNGSAVQQDVFNSAIDNLLHLDLGRFAFDLDVEFVDNPDPAIDNEFASAYADDSPPRIALRSDFPNFAPTQLWGSIQFAMETVIHEIAHILIPQLPSEVWQEVLDLFGVTQADFDDDGDQAWEDRFREGFAETFKDAFLPAFFRFSANRTNVKLPIHKYPAFRAIFRQEMEMTIDGGIGELDMWDVRGTPMDVLPAHGYGKSDTRDTRYAGYLPMPVSDAGFVRLHWSVNEDDWFVEGEDCFVAFQSALDFYDENDDEWLGELLVEVRFARNAAGSWVGNPPETGGLSSVWVTDDFGPSGVFLDHTVEPPLPPGAEIDPTTPLNDDWTPPLEITIDVQVPAAGVLWHNWSIQARTQPFLDLGMTEEEIVEQFETDVPTLTIHDTIDLFKTNGHRADWWGPPATSLSLAGINGLHRYLENMSPSSAIPDLPRGIYLHFADHVYHGAVATNWNPSVNLVHNIDGEYTGYVIVPVEEGQVFSYEWTMTEEMALLLTPLETGGDPEASGSFYWHFEKLFLGTIDPDIRCWTETRLAAANLGDPPHVSVLLESDNAPDGPEGHANSLLDYLDWRALNQPYATSWGYTGDGSYPIVMAEEFVVPAGTTRMAFKAEIAIQDGDLRPESFWTPSLSEIVSVLPTLMYTPPGGTGGTGIVVPAEAPIPPGEAVPGGTRGGSVRTKHGVMG